MNVIFETERNNLQGVLVVGVYKNNVLTPQAVEIDNSSQASITKALETSSFQGKQGQSLIINGAPSEARQIMLLGLGENKDLSDLQVEKLGASICKQTLKGKQNKVIIDLPCLCSEPGHCSALLASGYQLKAWDFIEFKTEMKAADKPQVDTLAIVTAAASKAKQEYEALEAILQGVCLTKQVTSLPGNMLYPEVMVNYAKELSSLGIQVSAMGEKELLEKGMNALYGVGMGSEKESFLCTMEWNGGESDQAPLCIVGKGITFDTGGISIKGRSGLDEMKFDMGGAGVVLGLMHALASRKAKVNVVGVMALAENMPSGSAQRPGDIVKSYSGKTIEILDTDAEGRLVLADALWYAQETYKPQVMVNLATLTGAILVSLGYEYAGMFSNSNELAEKLTESGAQTDEKVWRMPLHPAYDKLIDSKIADVKNLGNRWGGAITAAQFLQRFVNDVPWAHLDIAGAAWDPKGRPLSSPGSTAFGVRMLNKYIKDNYG